MTLNPFSHHSLPRLAVLLLLGLVPASRAVAQSPPPADAIRDSRARLVEASHTYRQSLERLLVLQTQDAERARALVEKNTRLLDMGLIARKQLESSQQEVKEALARQTETARQIDSLDQLLAEVQSAEAEPPASPAQPNLLATPSLVIRFAGSSRWSMGDITRVDAFFRLKFGRPLPVSALGQSETHQRLGFDHHEAIDVALHPDTPEGAELIAYLQSEGISFIAIRGAIAGSATGAHIHIGPPSKRTSPAR